MTPGGPSGLPILRGAWLVPVARAARTCGEFVLIVLSVHNVLFVSGFFALYTKTRSRRVGGSVEVAFRRNPRPAPHAEELRGEGQRDD